MTTCSAVKRNEGLESKIFEHFDLTPIFLMVNAKTDEVEEQTNRDGGRGSGSGQAQDQAQDQEQDLDPYSVLDQGEGSEHEFGCGF